MARRAKIVCTLGPATATPQAIRDLVTAGMDVARLNFSHGTHQDHETSYRMVREASDAIGRSVGILADLQGPKIRLGKFTGGPVEWATGEVVRITTDDVRGDHDRVSTTYEGLARDVRVDDRLLVDDGKVAVTVIGVQGNDIECLVVEGGPVSDHKGLSLPGVAVSVPAMSDKDADDLRFALGLSVDLVALSFVRSPLDVNLVRAIMAESGIRLPVIAKLEKPEAVADLEAIVEAFDGLMVARGDLGVELPLEQVPLVQKRAIQLCREHAKPVIVATQMLESMIESSRPSRAEVSDVANAVLDGADALMLSGETSVGRHPVQVVRTMSTIITTVEQDTDCHVPPLLHSPRTKGGAIAAAAAEVGKTLQARALCCFTKSGDTVRRLARYHSPLPLLAFTPEQRVRSQLALSWGVETFLTPSVQHTDEMVAQVQAILLDFGRFDAGEEVVIVAGSPPNIPGSTNAMRVWRLGDEIPRA
ncbi:MAG: pyruvate kinase [Pseudonocardiales bacterium]|nr:MAG: pyruvate kinase [Pseudonocardiales bacterium]